MDTNAYSDKLLRLRRGKHDRIIRYLEEARARGVSYQFALVEALERGIGGEALLSEQMPLTPEAIAAQVVTLLRTEGLAVGQTMPVIENHNGDDDELSAEELKALY